MTAADMKIAELEFRARAAASLADGQRLAAEAERLRRSEPLRPRRSGLPILRN